MPGTPPHGDATRAATRRAGLGAPPRYGVPAGRWGGALWRRRGAGPGRRAAGGAAMPHDFARRDGARWRAGAAPAGPWRAARGGAAAADPPLARARPGGGGPTPKGRLNASLAWQTVQDNGAPASRPDPAPHPAHGEASPSPQPGFQWCNPIESAPAGHRRRSGPHHPSARRASGPATALVGQRGAGRGRARAAPRPPAPGFRPGGLRRGRPRVQGRRRAGSGRNARAVNAGAPRPGGPPAMRLAATRRGGFSRGAAAVRRAGGVGGAAPSALAPPGGRAGVPGQAGAPRRRGAAMPHDFASRDCARAPRPRARGGPLWGALPPRTAPWRTPGRAGGGPAPQGRPGARGVICLRQSWRFAGARRGPPSPRRHFV
jgi:hypothetical protein